MYQNFKWNNAANVPLPVDIEGTYLVRKIRGERVHPIFSIITVTDFKINQDGTPDFNVEILGVPQTIPAKYFTNDSPEMEWILLSDVSMYKEEIAKYHAEKLIN